MTYTELDFLNAEALRVLDDLCDEDFPSVFVFARVDFDWQIFSYTENVGITNPKNSEQFEIEIEKGIIVKIRKMLNEEFGEVVWQRTLH